MTRKERGTRRIENEEWKDQRSKEEWKNPAGMNQVVRPLFGHQTEK